MFYFLGNCQADFLSRSMAARGHDVTYRVLASPLTLPSHPEGIPDSLAELDRDQDLSDYFHGRELSHQFQPIGPNDAPPKLIVLSLFHENTPLFVHNTEGYIFFMDPRALNDKPKMMQWAQDNCRMFKPNSSAYLERYRDFLARLRADFPGVPIVILQRLSHFPAFGPDPYSYLEGWDTLWPAANSTLGAWASVLDDVHVLDMNRVFGGIWQESEKRIEAHCPFLKLKLTEESDKITGLHARRDIEHIGPMPDRLADKLGHFLKKGAVEYGEAETIPREWKQSWRPAGLDDEARLHRLVSGANYQSAEAVASFFLDLAHDHTDLLVAARESMPVCHMTLHMIKAYSRIWRNPDLAAWCDAHLEAAKDFTANGPLYREAYVERVEGIRDWVSQ